MLEDAGQLRRRWRPLLVGWVLTAPELAGRRAHEHKPGHPVGMAHGEFLRDESAVGRAEDKQPVEAETARERVRVVGQLLHGQRVHAGAAGAPVAAVVVVDELEPVGQRVECRPQVRVVETQPAVHDQAGRSRCRRSRSTATCR